MQEILSHEDLVGQKSIVSIIRSGLALCRVTKLCRWIQEFTHSKVAINKFNYVDLIQFLMVLIAKSDS